jgi:hypothetical protein
MTDGATTDQDAGDSLVVEGQRFAIVPEWVIDADVGDCAFRLYAVLLRYGQSSGVRMPSRATLARRLHKRSVDTVDRAMKELVAAGAVVVERRRDGKQNLTNLYHVRTSGPGRTAPATSSTAGRGRTGAATPPARAATSGRTPAATPAASLRPDPQPPTEEHPPPKGEQGQDDALNFHRLAVECRRVRAALGLQSGLWTAHTIQTAYTRAVVERGWDGQGWEAALLAVAPDPATRTPLRAAEAGPWWELQVPNVDCDNMDLAALESRLDALDGERVVLQRQARDQLRSEGAPLTRATVLRRAAELLDGGLDPAERAGTR